MGPIARCVCGRNGLHRGSTREGLFEEIMYSNIVGEHESSGQNIKRAPLDVIVSKDTERQKL